MNRETVYVIGHRNPDTDSICSAIAYAELLRHQGRSGVCAARAGTLNRQTEFVLDRLGVSAPVLLTDVSPRVRDVVRMPAVTIDGEAPLAHALELLHQHDIRMLPVVDPEGLPQGLLFLKRAAEKFLIPGQTENLRRVLTSPEALTRCLRADVLHQIDAGEPEELELYVGAMAFETFQDKLTGLDPRRLLVVTGDRDDVLRHAVTLGVRILVITGNPVIHDDLLAEARRHRVTLLRTAFDTANSAWLIRLSTPVHCLMEQDAPTVGMNDSLDHLRLKLLHGNVPGMMVLNGSGKVAAVATKSSLLVESPVKLVLVDHNELSQAVAGADRVEILEVVDHHRLGNFHTDAPIRFVNQPVGSTCSVVAGLYRQAGLDPDPVGAGLLLAGLLSDTVILKSPTTTDIDRELAGWLGRLANLDIQEFGRSMFAAGSALSAYSTVKDLLLADFKEYQAGNRLFGVGQVEVVGFEEFYRVKEKIAEELSALRSSRKMTAAGLLVTDIVHETSLLLADGEAELPYLIGYPECEPGLYELKGVLSRKKQLVPHLLKVLKG
ncbi:MAG: putative manganese-dependent inorganic diphosphatase [Syntrophotaleaceae bacterium]